MSKCIYRTRRWLTIKVMADQAGIAPFTLRTLCKAAKVKARKVGGIWVVWADSEGLPIAPNSPVDLVKHEDD